MTRNHSLHSKLGDDGRVVVPAAFRKRFGLRPGDTLVWDDENGKLILSSYDQVLKEVQASFEPYRIPGRSEVDELIAERRAEAAQEENELLESGKGSKGE